MNLQQLKYAVAVVRHDLSVTAAANALGTSQPAISRALKALETELGFDLFVRSGRSFARLTPDGQRVIERAQRALAEIEALESAAADLRNDDSGVLSIATTHTQARYTLPPVIARFRERYPKVELHLHQGTSEQIAELLAADRVQLAIATGSEGLFRDLVLLPVYRWYRKVIVPKRHPLTRAGKLTLEALAQYPLVTYVFSFTGPSSLHQIFARAGLRPQVALTARDSDVIKTYVRLGLGVGIVASVALEPEQDADFAVLDASHLLPLHTTWVGFRRGTVVRGYVYEFIRLFGPHLDRKLIDKVASQPDDAATILRRVNVPMR
ncbi:MAG: LysR substrate-binding domain-containing protein [Steroidobacteraceae bacterium]|nr:LysR substrate-binding domain-containing protein [Steroidobacteraceae bacterium]MDW8258217.1 LysR substrate-binding domain-containing protein [Gammaproteobacteria bacterium]